MRRHVPFPVRRDVSATDARARAALIQALPAHAARVIVPPHDSSDWEAHPAPVSGRRADDGVNIAIAHELVNAPASGVTRVTIVDRSGVHIIEPCPRPQPVPATTRPLARAWNAVRRHTLRVTPGGMPGQPAGTADGRALD